MACETIGFSSVFVPASEKAHTVMVWPYGYEPVCGSEASPVDVAEPLAEATSVPETELVEVAEPATEVIPSPEPETVVAEQPEVVSEPAEVVETEKPATEEKQPYWKTWDRESDPEYRERKKEVDNLEAAGDLDGLEKLHQAEMATQRSGHLSGRGRAISYALVGDVRCAKQRIRARREKEIPGIIRDLLEMADEAIASGEHLKMIAALKRMSSSSLPEKVRQAVAGKYREVQQVLDAVNVDNVRAALQQMAEDTAAAVAAGLVDGDFLAALAAVKCGRERYKTYFSDPRLAESFRNLRATDPEFEDPWDTFYDLEERAEKARHEARKRNASEISQLSKTLEAAIGSGNFGAVNAHARKLQSLGALVDLDNCLARAGSVHATTKGSRGGRKASKGDAGASGDGKLRKPSKAERKAARAGR
ncbi:MAG: hypothetical protein PHQ43_14660 [Dehalococcoidales bacterium]|nr:hypothetical protein [Dehalococcoidales bacterium]